MTQMLLFPFAEYWWFYAAFTIFVLAMLALDLGVFHRSAHVVSAKEAAIWSVVWISLALVFSYGLHLYVLAKFDGAKVIADQVTLEFLTGYVIEKSLSVDNLFIFVLVFRYFAIQPAYQHRILFYGILGALVFRAIFISIGAALMRYEWIVMIFGVFLIGTGIKLAFSKEQEIDPEKNLLVKILRKFIPVWPKIEGPHFFVRHVPTGSRTSRAVWHATPLLLCLVFVEATDIIFAVDSVPAIFAITKEPLIVFTSNVFAIMGLRSLYFLLANVMDKFHLLKYGLAIVLVFVGLKMTWLNHVFGGKFPISWSLGIIFGVIAAAIGLSFVFPPKKD